MSPVDDLRSAAALLRQRAEHARQLMPGPWRVVSTDSESPDGVASCPLHEAGPTDACDRCSVIATYSEWVAPFVALLSPEAGMALADAMELLTKDYGGTDVGCQKLMLEGSQFGAEHPLLTLARLVLGRSE